MTGEANDFRTEERALGVLRAIRSEREEDTGEPSPVEMSLLEKVFEAAWAHQFDADRKQFKREVTEAVKNVVGQETSDGA